VNTPTRTPRLRRLRVVAALVLVAAASVALPGAPVCPAVFSDHMVLQRDRPVPVWGTAEPGEIVTVRFAGHERSVRTGDDGCWRVDLPPMAASAEPRVLTVEGTVVLEFTDVLVGEVWLASGQSNMEKPLGPRRGQKPTDDYEAEIASAHHPLLRLYQVPKYGRPRPGTAPPAWTPCSPEALQTLDFSAAGYYFGRELLRELGVPVGVVHSSFGGTQIEAWIPRGAFERDPRLAPLLEHRYFAWVEGVQATELYESMIRPLVPYALRGFLWYQGEANCMTGDTRIYTAKSEALITAWRDAFGDATAPFYFVQLAPFNYSEWDSFPEKLTPLALPLFREAQIEVQHVVPNIRSIVTTDLAGNARDIHPTNKRDIGLRLAGLALDRTYGHAGRRDDSPRFTSIRRTDEGALEVAFDHGDGALETRDGAAPSGFEIAGDDRRFRPAEAMIVGDRVVVRHDGVPFPQAVRFAFHETARPNLVGPSGLPVEPFRTDRWPEPHLELRAPPPEARSTPETPPAVSPPQSDYVP
jgi:sialate O-acetylesterase